jgi:hypothetical protein
MAGGAAKLGEVVGYYFRTDRGLVAIATGYRFMTSDKWKVGMLMFRQSVACRLKS